jgi:hypothetical protein
MMWEAVERALSQGSTEDLAVLADWLEDHRPDHPELETYCRRLRQHKTARVQTLIDVILKFGSRRERKQMSRINRIAMRRRKSGHRGPFPEESKNVFSWKDGIDIFNYSGRMAIRFLIGRIIPPENHGGRYQTTRKKVLLATLRRNRVHPNFWYSKLLVQLMRSTRP